MSESWKGAKNRLCMDNRLSMDRLSMDTLSMDNLSMDNLLLAPFQDSDIPIFSITKKIFTFLFFSEINYVNY